MILLDEATVYNVSHLFGFVSVFNTDALKNVDLYKAGFPARFGGRLSSVLDITMKEGNNQKRTGEWSIGLLSSRFLWEGPFSKKTKGRTSFMLSGRASYLGIYTLPFYIGFQRGEEDQYTTYWLYDVNAKLNHQFKNGGKLFLSFYRGIDTWRGGEGSSAEKTYTNLTWGNSTATLRYTRAIQSRLFFRTALTYSRYQYGLGIRNFSVSNGQQTLANTFRSRSNVQDWSLKTGFDYSVTSSQQLKFGIEAIHHRYQPSFIQTTYPVNPDTLAKVNRPVAANEAAVYAEDEISPVSWLKVNAGLRGVLFDVENRTYSSLEPRIALNISLPHYFAVKGTYSQMRQFIHLLTSNSIDFPNDVWVPATRRVPPQSSQQTAFGITKTIPKLNLEVSLEGYYKTMKNLIDYQDGSNFLTTYTNTWENSVAKSGFGEAYGLEFFVNKTKGRFTGWLAYTLAWNRRVFDQINNGNWYAAPYDRRHTLSLTGTYTVDEHVNISANWTFHSGQPVTVPIAVRRDLELNQAWLIYGDRNNFRMPAYHRLDLNFNFVHETRHGRQATWSVGIYNAYNRINPYFLQIRRLYIFEDVRNSPRTLGTDFYLQSVSALPFLPSVSYSLKY